MNREKETKKIEDARKTFKGFDVVFRNIAGENPLQILELRNPDRTGVYRLRVVFDEKGRTFTITGDLGEAVFYPTWPATLAHTAAVGMNAPYFMEKCVCSSDRYEYDTEEFKAELEKWIRRKAEEHNASAKLDFEKFDESDIEWDIGQIMGGFDSVRGFHGNDKDAQNALAKYGNDWYEELYDWGKGWHIRVYLWMAGIEYAYAKLKEKAEEAHPAKPEEPQCYHPCRHLLGCHCNNSTVKYGERGEYIDNPKVFICPQEIGCKLYEPDTSRPKIW